MSLTVHLARHGAHDEIGRVLSGRSAIALNQAGCDQAQRLAGFLSREPIETVYTSPRKRAAQTAAIVGDRIGVDPIVVDALDEIDFGEWSGRSFADLDEDPRWRAWNATRGRASTPSGETMASATTRAQRHLEACKEAGPILCVSHCDIIRGLVARTLGLDMDRLLAFDIDPASVTTVRLDSGSSRVVAVNERPT